MLNVFPSTLSVAVSRLALFLISIPRADAHGYVLMPLCGRPPSNRLAGRPA